MKNILIAIIMIFASSTMAQTNDRSRPQLQRGFDRLPYSLAIGMGGGMALMSLNHIICKKTCIDDDWFFLVPVAVASVDLYNIHNGYYSFGVRLSNSF